MSDPLRSLLLRQARRLRFYRLMEGVASALLAIFAFVFLLKFIEFICLTFLVFPLVEFSKTVYGIGSLVIFLLAMARRVVEPLNLLAAASHIEQQSEFFQIRPERKTELETAAVALTHPTQISGSSDLLSAHLQSFRSLSRELAHEVRPNFKLYTKLLMAGVAVVLLPTILTTSFLSIPSWLRPQTIRAYELQLAFDETWTSQTGSPYGVAGSWIRFPIEMPFGLRPFFFVKTQSGGWKAVPCTHECLYRLEERGEYSVGTSLFRGSIFPLLVIPDEAPKALILVEWKGEVVVSPTLLVKEKDPLPLSLLASDDIRLQEVSLIRKTGDQEEILLKKSLGDSEWKSKWTLQIQDWKDEETQIILRVSDHLVSTDSSPLVIKFDTEDQKRERRMQNLRAVVAEWVHILADLLETKEFKRPHAQLRSRLSERSVLDSEGDGLVAAYFRELDLLAKRIESWVLRGSPLTEVEGLIERTERQILYGLSLLFQEKTGDVASTSKSLQSSQKDLNNLLQKVKDGKLELNSEALKEAFKRLQEKLAELQEKIRNLPRGPSDDLINREALEAQAEETESLQERMEAIQRQIAEGKDADALRELESLHNQLSILLKEMERNFDQVQSNLDRGAIQSAAEYMKALEELQKREEQLAKRTEEAREAIEKAEEARDFQAQEKLEKQLQKLEEEQKKISEDFSEESKEFSEKLEGTEWFNLFRNEQTMQQEEQIAESMEGSKVQLSRKNPPEALVEQREAVERLRKLGESQQQMMQQIQQQAQSLRGQSSGQNKNSESVEILSSQGKGERERKQKIMGSLRQKVDEKYQKSHEKYFEELLQR